MELNDAVEMAGLRRTGDGYLVGDARIGRTGIQIYAGREVGRPDLGAVRVYRPETEVFADRAMASMAHRPVTNDHPSVAVNHTNWKTHSVGMTGGDVARDGHFIRVPMTVMDGAAISDIESGKRELSVGYTCDLKWEAGKTDDGEAFDAIQTNIRGNHLAIVRAGRAGPDCRLGDGQNPGFSDQEGAPLVADKPLKTVMVDGLSIETTDQGAQAIDKLQRLLGDAGTALERANAAHASAMAGAVQAHKDALAAKDREMGAKDAELTDAKAKIVTDAALDHMVADRAVVINRAKSLAPTLDTAGKTNADIKRAAVALKLGDAKVKDRSDDYVGALFDHFAIDAKTDPLRAAIIDSAPNAGITDAATAHGEYTASLNNAWQHKIGGK